MRRPSLPILPPLTPQKALHGLAAEADRGRAPRDVAVIRTHRAPYRPARS